MTAGFLFFVFLKLKMDINCFGNRHVETLQRILKTHVVVTTHTFFKRLKMLVFSETQYKLT